jgi:hypothetical protein
MKPHQTSHWLDTFDGYEFRIEIKKDGCYLLITPYVTGYTDATMRYSLAVEELEGLSYLFSGAHEAAKIEQELRSQDDQSKSHTIATAFKRAVPKH